MTVKEFKKAITKASWFDKYYYYIVSFAIIVVGLFFLYEAFFNTAKFQTNSSRVLMFCASLFCVALGIISLYLVPNRYKILTLDSKLSIEDKKGIIANTMKEFNAFFIDTEKCIWFFNYQRRWWTSDYNVYLSFDSDAIFVSVVGGTHGRGGFIDLGQTERFRRKIKAIITQKLRQKNNQ